MVASEINPVGIIARNLKRRGWSLGWVSAVDSEGRTIWIADAHRGGKRLLCVRMKCWRRLWNQNPRSGMSDARKNGRLSHFRPEHLKGRLAGNPATG
jgi:hypothetical protein